MKYIAEKDRKFIDKLAVQVYHTLQPINQLVDKDFAGRIITIDEKIILPGTDIIYPKFDSRASIIILIVLSGSIRYSELSGINKKLTKDDAVITENTAAPMYYAIENTSNTNNAQLIEISLSGRSESNTETLLVDYGTFVKNYLNNFFIHNHVSARKTYGFQFFKGVFDRKNGYVYPAHYKRNQIMVLLLKGEALINDRRMCYRDTLLLTDAKKISMDFLQETSFLLFEFNLNGKK